MNTATENLENDHLQILRLIRVMQKMTKQSEPSLEHLEKVVDLIRNYADGVHHAKEETLLFPSMAAKGFFMEKGPLAVMLSEHEQGRSFVKSMVASIADFKDGNKQVIPLIFENMIGYCDLLQAHISKENNILFKMADNVLTVQEQQDMLKQFARLENSQFCGSLLRDYVVAIDMLEVLYT